ncbi:MAG TPA: hypothetical protein VNH13_10820 [Candidatus Acidoferrales bacterium]|nr:hypothetical protein [Candidatus Acidoferrales bacterium]
MIGSLGSRLRLVLRQPSDYRDWHGPGGTDADALPEVDFVAYALHERLSGRVRLDSARLSDMLNSHEEFVLVDALAERLPDGGSMVVSEILLRRHELAVVHATGPRGDRSQRIRTETHPLVVRVGRYLVSGRLHVGQGQDALQSLRSRQAMVPLTEAAIEFRVGPDVVREPASGIVVNRDLVDWVREGSPVYDRSEVPWS